MQTRLGHIQFNVDATHVPFYKDLMTFLGWQSIAEDDGYLGVTNEHDVSVWFMGIVKDVGNDYDGPGLNHFAFATSSQTDVDTTASYLRERGVAPLFDTPCHRPEYAASESDTYYSLMFESPDRLLFEVVYQGPKSA